LEDARDWLRAYGYDDIANTIDEVMAVWKKQGKLTRRNWWEILAGGSDGSPRIAGGITFPVLRAARVRQGLPDVPNAIQRSVTEVPPPIRVTPRWPKKKRSPKKR
jgi:hypothetical protein